MPQVCTMCKVFKDESEFNQMKRKNEVRLVKSCRECNSKKSEEKRKAWSQHTDTCGSGRMIAKLQIRGRLLMIISVIPAINVEKRNQ